MVSIKNLTLLLSVFTTVLATNTVTFVNQDAIDRDVIWTPSDGCASIPTTSAPAWQSVTVEVPQSWIGNFYAIPKGSPIVPGMLGEVTFQGWGGLSYFDVSAIVNANDKSNVKQLWPKEARSPQSGCDTFPCNAAYYLPDDIQTKTTTETDLICALGTAGQVAPPSPATIPVPTGPSTQDPGSKPHDVTPSTQDDTHYEAPATQDTVPSPKDAASLSVASEITQDEAPKVSSPTNPSPSPESSPEPQFLESVVGRSYPPPVVRRNRQ